MCVNVKFVSAGLIWPDELKHAEVAWIWRNLVQNEHLWQIKQWPCFLSCDVFALDPRVSHIWQTLVAISLAKACLFTLCSQSETKQDKKKIACPPVFAEKKKKKPHETSGLGNIYGRLEPQETSRGKCSLSFSGPSLLLWSLLSSLPTLDLGAESLRKVKGAPEKSTDHPQMD